MNGMMLTIEIAEIHEDQIGRGRVGKLEAGG